MQNLFLNWRVTLFGFLTWLVPFAVSIPFFDPVKGLLIPLLLFKAIMVLTGTLCGVVLLVLVFRSVAPSARSGLVIGLYWLALNWLLDIVILVPMMGGDFGKWFNEIGLSYLTIFFIATGMGMVGGRKA